MPQPIEADITHKDELNILPSHYVKPQHREKLAGRPSIQTAIGKSRSKPKPYLRIRKNKHLNVIPISRSPAKESKTEITIIEVLYFYNYKTKFQILFYQ